jgi:hypothetical protein
VKQDDQGHCLRCRVHEDLTGNNPTGTAGTEIATLMCPKMPPGGHAVIAYDVQTAIQGPNASTDQYEAMVTGADGVTSLQLRAAGMHGDLRTITPSVAYGDGEAVIARVTLTKCDGYHLPGVPSICQVNRQHLEICASGEPCSSIW